MAYLAPSNPEQADAKPQFLRNLFSLVHDMAAVQRFSRIRMVHPENVLQHTGMVCVFAYAIAGKLGEVAPRDLRPLDMGAVMSRAVVHDWDETKTGDIVRPIKYFSEPLRAELAKLETGAVFDIAQSLGVERVFTNWRNAKYGREGFVVKLADVLAAVCAVYTETLVCGNIAMKQPAERMVLLLANLHNETASADLGWDVAEQHALRLIIEEAGRLLARVLERSYEPLPSLHGGA